jgi:hypothetical protein
VTAEGLPTALATSIQEAASAQPTGLTFTPGGEEVNEERPGAKAGAAGRLMTAEERSRVRDAIARASRIVYTFILTCTPSNWPLEPRQKCSASIAQSTYPLQIILEHQTLA